MVTSEDLFAFVQKMSKPAKPKVDEHGDIMFIEEVPLQGTDLERALKRVVELVEIEASSAATERHHDAQVRMMETRAAANSSPFGAEGGHGNYN